MAARTITAVKIKQLYYAEPLSAAPTKAGISAALSAATAITNVHQDTFQYEEAEPTINKYKNQLTGQVYRSDVIEGDVSIAFSIGQYDFAMKKALQGGNATDDSWSRGKSTPVYKAFYAVTEDDVCIVFPKARIIARGASTDNAVALALSAVPEESVANVASEYWFDIQGAEA